MWKAPLGAEDFLKSLVSVEVSYQNIFCLKFHEISRSAQKIHAWNPTPLEWRWEVHFPKMTFARIGMKCQGLYKKLYKKACHKVPRGLRKLCQVPRGSQNPYTESEP